LAGADLQDIILILQLFLAVTHLREIADSTDSRILRSWSLACRIFLPKSQFSLRNYNLCFLKKSLRLWPDLTKVH